MQNSIISEGNTTNEAIERGLKKLGVSKKDVDIKILEEEKKNFFDILAPRVVKVELRIKGSKPNTKEIKEIKVNEEELSKALEIANIFLEEFVSKLEKVEYNLEIKENSIFIKIDGDNASELIGHRGETLESLQTIISSIVNKETTQKIRIIIDILDYKEKRKASLESLAKRVANTVIKTGRPSKLDPMNSYERKIIHTVLQDNTEITTNSIGEEPYRRIIIMKK